jgi:hypothetical protein
VDFYVFFEDKADVGRIQRETYISDGFLYMVTGIGNLIYSVI